MPDTSLSIFISYSRTNSDFVDRLQADLLARNFEAWVDRHDLIGGQDWQTTIENAIKKSQVMLMVLSPKAIESENVVEEYRYAKTLKKRIIPLHYQTIDIGPMGLNDIQWIDFRDENKYLATLDDLLRALALIVPKPEPMTSSSPVPSVPLTVEASAEPDLVIVRPAPAPPPPDLVVLFQAGLEAKGNDDLDRAAILWQQIIDIDRNFNGGTLVVQMAQLNRDLLAVRIKRLRTQARQSAAAGDFRREVGAWQALLGFDPKNEEAQQGLRVALRNRAEKARRSGNWDEEIGTWEALKKLEPNNLMIPERIVMAQQNQQGDLLYNTAREFGRAGKTPALRETIHQLWIVAPFYGDPAGIIQGAGMMLPPDYETVRSDQLREIAVKAAQTGNWDGEIFAWKLILTLMPQDPQALEYLPIAEQNKQQEGAYTTIARRVSELATHPNRGFWSGGPTIYQLKQELQVLWSKAPYYGDPQDLVAKVKSVSSQFQLNVPLIYAVAMEQKKKAEEESRQAQIAKYKRDYENNILIAFWLLLLGVGGTTFLLTRSWQSEAASVGIAFVITYALTYRRLINIGDSLFMLTVASGCVYGISQLARTDFFNNIAAANLSQPLISHLSQPLGASTLYLEHQLLFGLILGGIFGLVVGTGTGNGFLDGILGGLFIGAIAWAVIAFASYYFRWGFGYGTGWELSLLMAFPLALAAGSGFSATIVYTFRKQPDFG